MSRIDASRVDWKKGGGLIPVIVQDAATLHVLMLGYMNEDALGKTEETGLVTFYSRSKKRLWQKGETSGNELRVVAMELDCDSDALLVRATPSGPTCHRETRSCFGVDDAPGLGWLARLETIIEERKAAEPDSSYTAQLFEAGLSVMAKKVGEEGVEVALAGAAQDGRVTEESADLVYHLLVLLNASGHTLADVAEILRDRHRASS